MASDKAKIEIPFSLHDGKTFTLVIDKTLLSMRENNTKLLTISRQINANQLFTENHTMVKPLVKMGLKPKDVITLVRAAIPTFLEDIANEAFLVSIFNGVFKVRVEDGRVIVTNIFDAPLPEKWWDDSEDNAVRVANFGPPNPPRNPANVVEQKIGNLTAVFGMYPELQQEFRKTFEDWLADKITELQGADVVVDDAGFQSSAVGGSEVGTTDPLGAEGQT